MKEKKVASLKIVFEDGSDYSVACEKGLDKDELAEYIERAFKPEPAEPLIKDEKVRKAVRAWAEATGTTRVNVWAGTIESRQNDARIYFDLNMLIDDGDDYTIAELCGEEKVNQK